MQEIITHDTSALILGLQSFSRDAEDNGSYRRRLDSTMELITYSFVLYLQHGRHDVKCKHQYCYILIIYCVYKKNFTLSNSN